MEAPDFTPLVYLAYIGLATVVLVPVIVVGWLVWRYIL